MTNVNNTPAVIDIDLSVTSRKKFRINGDDSRIVEINTSDMGILSRISEVYPKLTELQEKASKLAETGDADESEENIINSAASMGTKLAEIDAEMRRLIDYLFDANVSEVTAPDGSMYDPFNGAIRFEHIIKAFIGQYENNMESEFDKLQKQVSKHTNKYTAR